MSSPLRPPLTIANGAVQPCKAINALGTLCIPNIETVLKAPWQLDPLNRHGMLYELNPENVLILAGVHKAMQMMLLVP